MSHLLGAIELEPAKVTTSAALQTLPPAPQRVSFEPAAEIRNDPVLASDIDAESGILPKGRSIVVTLALCGVTLLSSLSTGLVTVGVPAIAADIGLPTNLFLWPSSVYALTSGSCLLLAGSVADVVGNRRVNLTGCFFVAIFMTACGLARTGIELIMFRAFQGVAVSLAMPTSVAIIANAIKPGRRRNIAFSCLGMVQCVGFSIGLVLGGVLVDTVGWRLGFYLCGGLTFVLSFVSMIVLPSDRVVEGSTVSRLRTKIDWIGAVIACTSLSLVSYVLATLSGQLSNISNPANIALLVLSLALIPVFVLWEQRQERRQQPALIPNSLWKNTVFTIICLVILFTNAVTNAMELFCSLFFQEVQGLSALQASLRILPSLTVGMLLNLSTGLLIHRLPAFHLIIASLALSAGAPLLMAVINAQWPYWYDAFFAQLLAPLSADILFTIGLLVVSDVFPTHTQALAGAVFNTVAQFGTSIGLTVMSVISAAATQESRFADKDSADALLVGYRASFWAAFAWMALACLIGAVGLRRIGKVGLKRD